MIELERYGWNARTERAFQPFAAAGQVAGRVLVEHRGSYVVATANGERPAVVSGRFRHGAAAAEDYPAVGDWVVIDDDKGDGDNAVIQAVLPRASQFSRPARGNVAGAQVVAANVDVVLIVNGLDHDFNLRRIERYVTLAWSSGAEPVIVLNKADLAEDVPARVAEVAEVAPGVPVRVLAARDGMGIETLTPLLEPGRTVALLGSSGVGKSTLVNALLGWDRQDTGAVRDDDQRGRHTTTVRELVLTNSGALLIDSPGMRSVGMWDVDEGLGDAFEDVEQLAVACRFTDCTHGSEPGCAVRAAIRGGQLAEDRFENYLKLARESAAMARRLDPEQRANSKKRWKVIHKSVRNHMRVKYGPEAGR